MADRQYQSLVRIAAVGLVVCSGAVGPALAAQPAKAAQRPASSPVTAKIDKVFAAWKPGQTPGCVVGVRQNGQAPVVRAYGMADLEHDVPNTPTTVFEAGSTSKQFTAAAVLRLAEQGKLSLTDDVRKYIPELPDYGHVITITHLLNHTSGIRDWGELASYAGEPRGSRVYTMQDVLGIAVRQKALNFVPGQEYSYTNTGFNLLTIIAERVSGKSLRDYTTAEFFAPLGMRHTTWREDFRQVVKARAIAYSPTETGFAQTMPFEDTYGHAGLLTTAGDMLIWNAALTDGRISAFVADGLAKRGVLNSGRQINYARGLIWDDYRGHPEIAHPGATAGYTAWLGRYPKDGLSIALLCNRADADNEALTHAVADIFLSKSPSLPKPKDAVRPQAGIEGLFVDEVTGVPVELKLAEGGLKVGGGQQLATVSSAQFEADGTVLRFEGTDRFTLADRYGGLASYRRGTAASPTAKDLAGYAGAYVSDEAGVTFLIGAKGNHLTLAMKNHPEAVFEMASSYADAFDLEGLLVRFDRNAGGKVTGLRLTGERVRNVQFNRLPDPAR